MNWQDFNLDKKDSIFLVIIAIFTLVTILFRINTHMNGGIYSPDVGLYLLNSLSFAQMDYYHVVDAANLYFAPLICMLTAILFKLGINFKLSILIVTGIFCFIGPFGLYILLKERFSRLLSLCGTILYCSFSIVVVNLSGGYIDVPATSIGIWIIVFLLLSVNKNPKYFLVLTPLFVVGFFTRYTVGFTLPVIVLYYMICRDSVSLFEDLLHDRSSFKERAVNYLHSDEFKYVVISIFLAAIVFAVFCGILMMYDAPLTFIGQSQGTLDYKSFSPKTANYVPNTIFYFKHFNYIIFNKQRDFNLLFSGFTLLLVAAGVLFKFINIIKNFNVVKIVRKNKLSFKSRKFDIFLKIAFVLLAAGFFVGFRLLKNHLIANITLFLLFLIFFAFIEKYRVNKEIYSLNMMFISWFAFYMVFITIYPIKVYRYAVPLLPPFVYFVMWGLENILDVFSNGFDDGMSFYDRFKKFEIKNNFSKVSKAIPIIFMVLLIISTVAYVAPLETKENTDNLVKCTDYIIANDPDYHNHSVITPYSFASISKFYLQTNVTPVAEADISSMNDTYLIIDRNITVDNYNLTQRFGDINLYTYVNNTYSEE